MISKNTEFEAGIDISINPKSVLPGCDQFSTCGNVGTVKFWHSVSQSNSLDILEAGNRSSSLDVK
jgi:hypothetical protein